MEEKSGLQIDWLGFSTFATYKEQHIFFCCRIQTSQTGDELYSDTYPYGECSLVNTGFSNSFLSFQQKVRSFYNIIYKKSNLWYPWPYDVGKSTLNINCQIAAGFELLSFEWKGKSVSYIPNHLTTLLGGILAQPTTTFKPGSYGIGNNHYWIIHTYDV